MKVQLISKDPDLHQSCRRLLAAMRGDFCELVASPSFDSSAKADVYIWDFHPDLALPEGELCSGAQLHLFLAHRKQVHALFQKVPGPGVALLLKPVTQAALKAFLEGAIKRAEARTGHGAGLTMDGLEADRDEFLQALLEANLELQEYDQDRTNFLARAVHDFRAPLTALHGYCGLVLGGLLGPLNGEQKEVLGRMQHSIKRLSRMANAMFELSIGHEVKRRPDLQYGDIEVCLDHAIHELAPLSEEKQISMTVKLASPEQRLYFDAGQMEQVLINLLDNACKFTPKCGHIEIEGAPCFWERRGSHAGGRVVGTERRTRRKGGPNAYRVDIRDSGPGVPIEHLQTIFEEYTSYTGPKDRSGGGLGLAICKSILAMHDGQAFAEPCSEGAAFSFLLPFRQAEEGHAAAPRSTPASAATPQTHMEAHGHRW